MGDGCVHLTRLLHTQRLACNSSSDLLRSTMDIDVHQSCIQLKGGLQAERALIKMSLSDATELCVFMDTEMRLGHEIAEEEVGRIQEYSQNQVEERDERYMRCAGCCGRLQQPLCFSLNYFAHSYLSFNEWYMRCEGCCRRPQQLLFMFTIVKGHRNKRPSVRARALNASLCVLRRKAQEQDQGCIQCMGWCKGIV
eukprot:scaffold51682_cov20-Tisochrysis_lutea.AAC.1